MRTKVVKLDKRCEAILTILIREVQDCSSQEELDKLLDSWVKANGLHPERVTTLTNEGFKEYLHEQTNHV